MIPGTGSAKCRLAKEPTAWLCLPTEWHRALPCVQCDLEINRFEVFLDGFPRTQLPQDLVSVSACPLCFRLILFYSWGHSWWCSGVPVRVWGIQPMSAMCWANAPDPWRISSAPSPSYDFFVSMRIRWKMPDYSRCIDLTGVLFEPVFMSGHG